MVRAEFGKLFDEMGKRVQYREDKVDHLEDSFSQAHDHEAIRDLSANLKSVRDETRGFALASNDSEQYHRRLSLRFKGLVIDKDADCRKAVVDFVRGTVKVPITEEDIEIAHTLPNRTSITEVPVLSSASTNRNSQQQPQVSTFQKGGDS